MATGCSKTRQALFRPTPHRPPRRPGSAYASERHVHPIIVSRPGRLPIQTQMVQIRFDAPVDPSAYGYMRIVLENVSVIIAVEGPSAAGKTTWCRRHASEIVEEYAPTGAEPNGTDMSAQADYWTDVNSRRWAQAVALEARTGLAICDSDPLKLHYSWCLSRIGAAPWARFRHELAQVRRAFLAGALGLADLVLVSIPPLELLRAQRLADPTRSRRSFELHARLGEH